MTSAQGRTATLVANRRRAAQAKRELAIALINNWETSGLPLVVSRLAASLGASRHMFDRPGDVREALLCARARQNGSHSASSPGADIEALAELSHASRHIARLEQDLALAQARIGEQAARDLRLLGDRTTAALEQKIEALLEENEDLRRENARALEQLAAAIGERDSYRTAYRRALRIGNGLQT